MFHFKVCIKYRSLQYDSKINAGRETVWNESTKYKGRHMDTLYLGSHWELLRVKDINTELIRGENLQNSWTLNKTGYLILFLLHDSEDKMITVYLFDLDLWDEHPYSFICRYNFFGDPVLCCFRYHEPIRQHSFTQDNCWIYLNLHLRKGLLGDLLLSRTDRVTDVGIL